MPIPDASADEPITASMVEHFKDLFDVENLEGVYPKMNELYVYVQETKTGLKIIANLLNLPETAAIVKILEEAATSIRGGQREKATVFADDTTNIFEASTTIQV